MFIVFCQGFLVALSAEGFISVFLAQDHQFFGGRKAVGLVRLVTFAI